MAYAKELTITLGQTVFTGDSESDEKINSQEVRVEVTYVLERDDMDVPLLANVKAAEVQHALTAAKHQLRARPEPIEAKLAVSVPTSGNGFNGPPRPSPGSVTIAGRAGNGYTRPAPVPPVQDNAPKIEWITKTQKLAIQPMLTRLSLNDHEVRALLDEQFGKKTLEALTREEGHQLLQALQRDEWEPSHREAAAH